MFQTPPPDPPADDLNEGLALFAGLYMPAPAVKPHPHGLARQRPLSGAASHRPGRAARRRGLAHHRRLGRHRPDDGRRAQRLARPFRRLGR